ncbi:MAG: 16S rRNA (cytosine(967)-C(5))-methyltransferase RsmB [Firmicutes bacterium]|nr:16S rRNA (cytosine(967)-C(5))-methyltransferase RsmB [Bacillota bacterium]
MLVRSRLNPPDPRAIAFDVLHRADQGGAFANLLLERKLEAPGMDPRDRALATSLVYGVLKSIFSLDLVLGRLTRRKLESLDPAVRTLLRLGAYQLLYMDRVPSYAAVGETVSLARRRAPRGSEALVNAVLRRASGEGKRILAETVPSLEHDPVEHIALSFSHPRWLVRRWVERFGPAGARALAEADNRPAPLTLRANLLRVDRAELAAVLAEEGIRTSPCTHAPEGLRVCEGAGADGGIGGSRAFGDGLCTVQDEGAMLIAPLLEPSPGRLFVDVCGAPGGKSTHLAELARDQARVVSCDPSPARLALAERAAKRLGITRMETLASRAEDLPGRLTDAMAGVAPAGLGTAGAGAADRVPADVPSADGVLVDAPCSGLGVLRRKPDSRWRREAGDLETCAAEQKRILRGASGLVRPGGLLVYAVCSMEPEETDRIRDWFLQSVPSFRPAPMVSGPPYDDLFMEAGDRPEGILRLYPHVHGTDGFFAARFRREGA